MAPLAVFGDKIAKSQVASVLLVGESPVPRGLAVVLIGAMCHVVGGRGRGIANAVAFHALGMLWKACYVAEPVV
jgi:hypothetical protein